VAWHPRRQRCALLDGSWRVAARRSGVVGLHGFGWRVGVFGQAAAWLQARRSRAGAVGVRGRDASPGVLAVRLRGGARGGVASGRWRARASRGVGHGSAGARLRAGRRRAGVLGARGAGQGAARLAGSWAGVRLEKARCGAAAARGGEGETLSRYHVGENR
jgi:hypothetical protein